MRLGRYTMDVSNADKLFFPEVRLTKGDLVEYYRQIAPTMLLHTRGRPVTMERHPDGVKDKGFYQKELPEYFPSWVGNVTVAVKDDGRQKQVACEKAADLVYIAEQGCITPHVWLSRKNDLDKPDRMILDLDPPDHGFAAVRKAARRVRDLLAELGLVPFVMLTGGRGVHVVCPLTRRDDFDTVREFAQGVAGLLAERHPKELTTEQRKNKRRGRVFLDTGRNAYGQTAVAPYAVRARPKASIAAPLDWDELSSPSLRADRYTVKNIFKRLKNGGDPWGAIVRSSRSLARPRERLRKMQSA